MSVYQGDGLEQKRSRTKSRIANFTIRKTIYHQQSTVIRSSFVHLFTDDDNDSNPYFIVQFLYIWYNYIQPYFNRLNASILEA